jgi:hypothetical protein
MPEPKTAAASAENLADFVERLESACVAGPLIDAMIERIRHDEAEAKAKAARLFFGKEHGERLTLFDFTEELRRVTSRCFGLCVAIQGILADEDGRFEAGIYQLAIDVAEQMERLQEAYGAEPATDLLAKQDTDADWVIGCASVSGQRSARQASSRGKSGERVMIGMEQCAELAGLAAHELPLCALPAERHGFLLESYRCNLKRGKAAVCKMILADLWRFMDLGAWERAADLLVAYRLFLSGCASPECLKAKCLAL